MVAFYDEMCYCIGMEKFPSPESNTEQKYSQIIDLGLDRHNFLTARSQAAMAELESTAPDHEAVTFTASPEPGEQKPLSFVSFDKMSDDIVGAKVKIRGTEYESDVTGWQQIDKPGKYYSHADVINLLNDSFGLPNELLDSPVDDLSYLNAVKQSIEESSSPDIRIKTYQSTEINIDNEVSIDEINYRLQSVQTKDSQLAYVIEASAPHYVDSKQPTTSDSFIEKTVQYVATGEHVGKARITLAGTSPRIAAIEEHTRGLSKQDLYDYYHPDDLRDTFSGIINTVLADKLNDPSLKQL